MFEKKSPVLINLITPEGIGNLRVMLLDKDRSVRETTLRSLRYLLVNSNACKIMRALKLPIIICRSTELDDTEANKMERFQSLKLISQWIDADALSFPQLFCRSVISIALNPEDSMRKASIEIVRQIAVHNPKVIYIISSALGVLEQSFLSKQY